MLNIKRRKNTSEKVVTINELHSNIKLKMYPNMLKMICGQMHLDRHRVTHGANKHMHINKRVFVDSRKVILAELMLIISENRFEGHLACSTTTTIDSF